MRCVVLLTLCGFGFVKLALCAPVVAKEENKGDSQQQSDAQRLANPLDDLEYNKYIQEVVSILDQDEEFRKRLEAANASAAEAGSVAMSLEFANKNTRTRLDELKRVELQRLQTQHLQLVRLQADLKKIDMEHLDHANPYSFEVEDLKKLIKKTTDDLHKIDTQRREEFKRYEMLKEHEYREQLKQLNETQRVAAEREHEARARRHGEHPSVNHPGNEEQLQEVWEQKDHLDKEDFNARTFFNVHDVNGDDYLDETELAALFQNELDKVYSPGNPDDDPVMRIEEMNRMREHYFNESDVDRDGLISREEFLKSTESKEYKKKEEWETLEKQRAFTDEEYRRFEEQYAAAETMEKQQHHEQAARANTSVAAAPVAHEGKTQ